MNLPSSRFIEGASGVVGRKKRAFVGRRNNISIQRHHHQDRLSAYDIKGSWGERNRRFERSINHEKKVGKRLV